MNDHLKTKAQLIEELESLRKLLPQNALLDELTRSQILFDQSPDGILIIDPQTAGFIEFNASAHEQLGYTREEFAKLTIRDIEAPETDSGTNNTIANLLQSGQADFEMLQHTKNGDLRSVHVTARTIDVNDDRVYFCVWQDISELKRAEDALQESEEKYQTLALLKKAILDSPEGIIVFALDKNYCYLDFTSIHQQTMEMIWGVTIEQGGNMLAYIKSASDREKAKANIDRALQGERFLEEEEYGDEELHRSFYEDRYGPVFDENGDIIGVSVFVIDITERKQAAELLRISEERLQLVIKGSNDAPWDWDFANKTIYYSPQWWSQIGYEPDELLVTDQLWYELTHPDDRNTANATLDEAQKTDMESYQIEFRLRHKLGHFVPILSRGFITRDESGNILRVTGTNMDLSEWKQMQSKLAENEAKFRNSFEAADVGMAMVSAQGKFISVNRSVSRILGYSQDEFLSMSFVDITHPQDMESSIEKYQQCLEDQQSYTIEKRYVSKKGNIKWGLLTISPIFDTDDELIYSIAHLQDITERKEAEEALQASEERFNLAMQASNDGLFDWNLETNEIYYSPGWKKMLGYADHELADDFSVWERTTDPEDVKRSWALQQKLITKQIDRFVMEFKMKHKDGHWIDILSRAEAIFNDSGKAIRIVGTHTNITAHKRAEDALQRSEEEKRTIADYTYDWESWFALDGALLWVNPAVEKLTGYSIAECQKMPKYPLPIVHKDDQKALGEHLQQAIAEKKSINNFEFRISHKDGSILWMAASWQPIYDDQKQHLGQRTSMRDITKRKKTEDELARSEQDYRGLFDMAHDAIILFEEKDEIVVEANQHACDLYGYSRDEFIGMSLANISTDIDKGKSRVKEVIKKGYIKQFETIQKRKDGSRISVEINASRTNYQGNSVILSLNHDITNRKQAEEDRKALEAQLRQSQKLEAIGTMVGGISHEFNNVLQSMFLYSGLVQDKLPDNEELRSNFQHILNDGNRARDLIKQILTFSRETKVAMKPQPLHEMVMEVLALERASLPANIDIQQDIDLNCGLVLCDKTQIHQILINLCNNAQHAMEDKGGTLSVSLKQILTSLNSHDPETDVLELTVKDTGHGIGTDDLERIFDPFFTTKQFGKGTGLGLSVIHGIVEMMDGQISAISEIGKGTTFRILFPVTTEVEADAVTQLAGNEAITNRSVLLVDDEKSIRSVTQTILTRKGFKVDSASDGKQALELFKANPGKYELIVTDQSMPKMSGVELTQAIRKTDPDIPIILSTGQLGIEDAKEFKNIGITAFIQKPWTANELMTRIQELKAN